MSENFDLENHNSNPPPPLPYQCCSAATPSPPPHELLVIANNIEFWEVERESVSTILLGVSM